jgi:hypothetical protein
MIGVAEVRFLSGNEVEGGEFGFFYMYNFFKVQNKFL